MHLRYQEYFEKYLYKSKCTTYFWQIINNINSKYQLIIIFHLRFFFSFKIYFKTSKANLQASSNNIRIINKSIKKRTFIEFLFFHTFIQ